ncbi:MAG TPA: HAD-IC family P-type ATPase, partial [Chloroflexota bacterium]
MRAVQQRPPVDLPSAERPIHTLPQEEVYRRLGTSPQGLSEAEAAARLARYGPNVLPEEKRTPLVVRFLAQFVHLFAALLWVAAGLAFVGGLPELGWAIIVVIAVNAVFSFWQEYKAERAIEALRDLLPPRATVVREGEERKILARDLVPGDVLILAEGDLVSADARLVAASQLRTNQAALTGESLPVPKTAEPILEPVVSPLEAANLVFAGTTVATGTGRAVVFATNGETQFGRVAHLTQTVSPGPTPLERQLERVTRVIALLAVGIGVVFFALGLLTGLALIEGFLFAVGVIVANVPEGLLPTLTLALAIAVQRMARRNALVKQLVAVETLGACTVICTDKTGTLTANEMTVQALWIDGQMYQVTGVGYQPEGEVLVD